MSAATPSRRLVASPKVWLRAIRVFSFTASVIPILIGAAVAAYLGAMDILLTAVMLLASVACHAGSNLANDYYDHKRGTDTGASLGPSGVIQSGQLTPEDVRIGMIAAFGIATGLGLLIVAVTGWQVLLLALAALGIAYLYTGGPIPLGYVGLGEIAVFFAMGPAVVAGAAYVLTGRWTLLSILVSIPVGFLVAAILHANNLRDIEVDRAAGKSTLATMLGRGGGNREFVLLIAAAYVALPLLLVSDGSLWPALLPLASVPAAVALSRYVIAAPAPEALNPGVRRTAALHFRFGVLLTAGLIIATVLRS